MYIGQIKNINTCIFLKKRAKNIIIFFFANIYHYFATFFIWYDPHSDLGIWKD